MKNCCAASVLITIVKPGFISICGTVHLLSMLLLFLSLYVTYTVRFYATVRLYTMVCFYAKCFYAKVHLYDEHCTMVRLIESFTSLFTLNGNGEKCHKVSCDTLNEQCLQ